MQKPQTLCVASNPFCVVDADGEPHGAVQRTDKASGRRLIGCAVDFDRSSMNGDDVAAPHEIKYLFTSTPESIPDTHEHRHFLRTGELLCADAETAEKMGMQFVTLDAKLDAERARAAALHKAHTGEDSPFLTPPAPAARMAAIPKPAPAMVDGGKSLWVKSSSSV